VTDARNSLAWLGAPGERVVGVLGQRDQREVGGHAVVLRTGLEVVGEREGHPLLVPLVGVVPRSDLLRRLVDQHRGVEGQQVRPPLPGALPPGVEVGAGDHLLPHPGVVEVEQRVLVDHDVPPPGAVLELLGLLEERPVAGEEAVVGLPLAVHEGVPDEELPGGLRVHRAVADQPVRDEGHAVEGDPLVGHHRGPLAGPVRLRVAPLDQVGAEPLGPLGLDGCVHPGVEP
jgi:hypothetical protein